MEISVKFFHSVASFHTPSVGGFQHSKVLYYAIQAILNMIAHRRIGFDEIARTESFGKIVMKVGGKQLLPSGCVVEPIED